MAQDITFTAVRYVGILTNNRNMLVAYCRNVIAKAGVEGLPFLRIGMPCGEVFIAETEYDIPQEALPCTCGNPQHWFIKYESPYKETHKN